MLKEKKMDNYINVKFKSIAENESLSRMIISGFIMPLNPTVDELTDIKTSVSEAVTNCVVHAYENNEGLIEMSATLRDNILEIEIKDTGVGIEDINIVKKPLYTTKPEQERSGMGFTIMESFMDSLVVLSQKGKGTVVRMKKYFKEDKYIDE